MVSASRETGSWAQLPAPDRWDNRWRRPGGQELAPYQRQAAGQGKDGGCRDCGRRALTRPWCSKGGGARSPTEAHAGGAGRRRQRGEARGRPCGRGAPVQYITGTDHGLATGVPARQRWSHRLSLPAIVAGERRTSISRLTHIRHGYLCGGSGRHPASRRLRSHRSRRPGGATRRFGGGYAPAGQPQRCVTVRRQGQTGGAGR
jgi:hypothetical protein